VARRRRAPLRPRRPLRGRRQHEGLRRELPRFRERDFTAVEHLDGISPAWPFGYADLEPYYGEGERIYRVHGTTGEDPTEPWRSTPFPFPAIEHEPYVAALAGRLRAQGVNPSSNAMGVDRRQGGLCIRCATCDGFPCRLGAKSDAETCAIDPAIATGRARLATGMRVRRLVTDGSGRRVDHLDVDAPGGPVTVVGGRFVLAAGAVNSARCCSRRPASGTRTAWPTRPARWGATS
jgi:choline dehydrogenase-like flavoprotein